MSETVTKLSVVQRSVRQPTTKALKAASDLRSRLKIEGEHSADPHGQGLAL